MLADLFLHAVALLTARLGRAPTMDEFTEYMNNEYLPELRSEGMLARPLPSMPPFQTSFRDPL